MPPKRKVTNSGVSETKHDDEEMTDVDIQNRKISVVRMYLPSSIQQEWLRSIRYAVENMSKIEYLGSRLFNLVLHRYINSTQESFRTVAEEEVDTRRRLELNAKLDSINSALDSAITTRDNVFRVAVQKVEDGKTKKKQVSELKKELKIDIKQLKDQHSQSIQPIKKELKEIEVSWSDALFNLIRTCFASVCQKSISKVKGDVMMEWTNIIQGAGLATDQLPVMLGLGSILTWGAKQYLTMFENYLVYGLQSHGKRYLQLAYGVSSSVAEFSILMICGFECKDLGAQMSVENKKISEKIVGQEGVHESFMQRLKYHSVILGMMEQLGGRTFPLAPLCDLQLRYVRVDVTGLKMIHSVLGNNKEPALSRCGAELRTQQEPISIKDVLTSSCINAKGGNWGLGSSFVTNGVEIHVAFEKTVTRTVEMSASKRQKMDKDYEDRKETVVTTKSGEVDGRSTKERKASVMKTSDHLLVSSFAGVSNGSFSAKSIIAARDSSPTTPFSLVSIDPGHINLATGVRLKVGCTGENSSDFEEVFKISNASYYDRIGANAARFKLVERKKRRQNSAVVLAEQDMSVNSLKTASRTKYVASLRVHLSHWLVLRAFYCTTSSLHRQFNIQMRKQKVLNEIVKKIAPGKDDIVALGDAAFPSTFKGTQASAMGIIRRLLEKKRRVVRINEFRTSKRCSCCKLVKEPPDKYSDDPESYHGAYMTQPLGQKICGNGRRYRIRGLMQCRNCGVTWNRDVNAAINIGMVFMKMWSLGERPAHLCRVQSVVGDVTWSGSAFPGELGAA